MSSLIDQTTISDHHIELGNKVIQHLKTYSLFVFYQQQQLNAHPSMNNLERLTFKLKDDKNQYTQKYSDNNKNVHLNFCSMESEMEMVTALQYLKVTLQEHKIRIVCYSSESALLRLYLKAETFGIPIHTIPICIYTANIHSDFSSFLGWGQPQINGLSAISVLQIEGDVRKWVESPTQKIDIWSVQIQVSQQGGSIEKINQEPGDNFSSNKKTHKQYFMSNLSIGYHPQLLGDYQERKPSKQASFFNKFIFNVKGMKKFCCVGNTDMRQSTGIVKIDFSDEKGGSKQILKQFVQVSQFQEAEHVRPMRDKRKILSILLSNINKFMGNKIQDNQFSRMNDSKLQLFTFQSIKNSTKISSIPGGINVMFSPDHPVDLQVNDSCFRLNRPLSLRIEHHKKAKVIINKQTLSC